MVSWWVPYLAKGRPNFNNGLGIGSNSGPISDPSVYLNQT